MPVLLRIEQRREEAARVVRAATPGCVKRYRIRGAIHPTAISRARKGDDSNPILRVAIMMESIVQAGGTREHLELIVAHLQGVVDDLAPASSVCFDEAMRAEQRADAAEDVVQVDALLDPTRIACYVDAAERSKAALSVAIAAARQAMREVRKAA